MRKYKRKTMRNPDKRMEAAVRLHAQGLSLRQIAAELAYSFSMVRYDLARWDREHANVVPLCKTGVQNPPHGGKECTAELHSEPSKIVSLGERRATG